ncbi:MAG: hypothetical protein PHO14_06195 [Kiritimatiellae bacterium]|nr:hypothetical protein [Kiritimatiellia bacterium]
MHEHIHGEQLPQLNGILRLRKPIGQQVMLAKSFTDCAAIQ